MDRSETSAESASPVAGGAEIPCTPSTGEHGYPPPHTAHRNPASTRRSTWAELLRRVFAIDVLTCPYGGGVRRLIAMITDGLVVRRILEHLQLPSTPPALAQARAPPELEFAW